MLPDALRTIKPLSEQDSGMVIPGGTMPSTRKPLAKPDEVAEYLKKPPKTLAEWRSRGVGPRYFKVGNEVRYSWADVDEWLAALARQPSPAA
jgi:predicted DNA-binding transcriptional regulator AlpA